jgi:hypothetical protein
MSRSFWCCRNPGCPVRGGVVLGRITSNKGLVLDAVVKEFAVYLDTRRATVTCPACGTRREFRGNCVRR